MFWTLPGANAPDAGVPPPARRTEKGGLVALVCMPWGALDTPSIAMGLLKRYVHTAGFVPELHYFNIRFAERIGLPVYQRIARTGLLETEWFFSQALFGPQGTGDLDNDWLQMRANPAARSMLDKLMHVVGLSEDDCRRLATEHVPAFIDECAGALDWSRYMAVGFTTMFAQSLATLLLAKRIKQQHAGVQIVLGGANVESEMGVEVLRGFDWVDFVVHGEAERSFPSLLDSLAAGRIGERIPGVSMRHDGEVVRGDLTPPPMVDMNDVPAPDYSDYLVEMELAGFRNQVPMALWFESARGCWWGAKHHCTFCGLNGSSMAFRKKDAAKVYAEIIELANTYRCLQLAATDNILANEYFTDLLPKLAELDSDLEFFYSVKANLRREQLRLMARAGVTSIQPGIESFNSRLLQLMRKGVSAIQNIQLLKWCHELGIQVNYSILYGFPGETPDDYGDLPTIFQMLSHLRPPGDIVRVVVERFSPYFFDREQFKLQYQPWREYEYIYPPARVDIAKVAFFFHGSWADQVGEPDEYIAPARAALREWRAHAASDEIFCCYEKGADYVHVRDNRRRRSTGALLLRGFDLNERQSALFLFCDENRSFQSIVTMMQARFGVGTSVGMVRQWLDDLVHQWLMFREGDRYLTVAVRKTHLRRAVRISD